MVHVDIDKAKGEIEAARLEMGGVCEASLGEKRREGTETYRPIPVGHLYLWRITNSLIAADKE